MHILCCPYHRPSKAAAGAVQGMQTSHAQYNHHAFGVQQGSTVSPMANQRSGAVFGFNVSIHMQSLQSH